MSDRIETRFTRDYGVRHPIALAPMAFVGTAPDLAIAVCKAGGLGSLAVGPLPADAVRGLIKAVRAATDAPLNVNFITFLANQAQIQACIDEGVSVVSFHWGHPRREFVAALHQAGIKIWEQVGSVAAAKEAVDSGVDLIIAQGSEAGGHNYGSLPTFVLVPSILEAVAPTPVLAAGGIATGRQLVAALVLGADAVSIGTRFVASAEAFAHAEYKRRLVEAAGTATRLSSVYGPNMPHFNPMRVLDVGLAHEFAGREDSAPKDLESQPIIGTMRLAGETVPLHRFTSFVPTPETEGQIDDLPFLAGQGVGLIHEVMPVAQIIESLVVEAASELRRYR
ncbi:MAG TPA: nitronate monooxygenase [Nitrospira sp.]|nr:nitronate monooxygenase [Nitrospira sp.]